MTSRSAPSVVVAVVVVVDGEIARIFLPSERRPLPGGCSPCRPSWQARLTGPFGQPAEGLRSSMPQQWELLQS